MRRAGLTEAVPSTVLISIVHAVPESHQILKNWGCGAAWYILKQLSKLGSLLFRLTSSCCSHLEFRHAYDQGFLRTRDELHHPFLTRSSRSFHRYHPSYCNSFAPLVFRFALLRATISRQPIGKSLQPCGDRSPLSWSNKSPSR